LELEFQDRQVIMQISIIIRWTDTASEENTGTGMEDGPVSCAV